MRIGEFVNRVNVSIKTAKWIHDNILENSEKTVGKHTKFSEEDVLTVNGMKLENYSGRIKRVRGYKNYYISSEGKVYTYRRNILEEIAGYSNNGYRYVRLWENGRRKNMKVSRLVADGYLENVLNKPTVNHKDGDKNNDNYINLEWATYSENTQHAFDTGLAKNDKGKKDSQSIPVDLYRNNGEFIRSYGSICEASRETGRCKGSISNQAKHNRTGRDGFSFRYSK